MVVRFGVWFLDEVELLEVVEGEEVVITISLEDLAFEELQLFGFEAVGAGEIEEDEEPQHLHDGFFLVDTLFDVVHADIGVYPGKECCMKMSKHTAYVSGGGGGLFLLVPTLPIPLQAHTLFCFYAPRETGGPREVDYLL